MYQCSNKLVTYKEYSCFDHSDFPGHSMFTSDVCWDSLGTRLVSLGTQVQPQVILDPDYLSDYLSVSYDYAVGVPKFFSSKTGLLKNYACLFCLYHILL